MDYRLIGVTAAAAGVGQYATHWFDGNALIEVAITGGAIYFVTQDIKSTLLTVVGTRVVNMTPLWEQTRKGLEGTGLGSDERYAVASAVGGAIASTGLQLAGLIP